MKILSKMPLRHGNAGKRFSIGGTVKGNQMSGQLFLDTVIVLARVPQEAGQLSPRLPAARMWQERFRTRLEGNVLRFPIQTASLSSVFGEGHMAARALWFLEHDPGNPERPLYGSTRLFLNDDFPDFVQKISKGDPFLLHAMWADVMCQMIEPALMSDDLFERTFSCDDANSTGYQINRWICDMFNEPQEARREYLADPARFRAMVNGFGEMGEAS